MSTVLEASIHVPLTLILISLSILHFPIEYGKIAIISRTHVETRRIESAIYESYETAYVSLVKTNPQKLIELILWADDQITSIHHRIKER